MLLMYSSVAAIGISVWLSGGGGVRRPYRWTWRGVREREEETYPVS